jgi:hypothetical protein
MHQTKKGNQWYFGMKAHFGVDSRTKLIHAVVATPANVAESTVLPELLHGQETRVCVLSARRANKLLHDMLFERVRALSVRSFARNFRGAEVDMHFSLSQDMVTLPDFLAELREHGQGKVSHMLADGYW